MTEQEKKRVRDDIDNEGFHYNFHSYDTYDWIEDPKFHDLREAYLQSVEDLEEYIK